MVRVWLWDVCGKPVCAGVCLFWKTLNLSSHISSHSCDSLLSHIMRFLCDHFLLFRMKMQNRPVSTSEGYAHLLPPSLKKHLLFYSRNCQDCSDVICSIRKNASRSSYMFICVDDGHQIPAYVDRVPTIITCQDGNVFKGNDSVMKFVMSSGVQSVEPCSASSDLLRGAKGDAFSFLDDQVCDGGYSCYLPIDMIEQGVYGGGGSDFAGNAMNSQSVAARPCAVSGPDKILEGIIQQREREENEFKNAMKYAV